MFLNISYFIERKIKSITVFGLCKHKFMEFLNKMSFNLNLIYYLLHFNIIKK